MENNNPAEMSNQDLEKDMQKRNEQNNSTGNQEDISKSTAAEGTLKSPADDVSSAIGKHTSYNPFEEQDMDDLVHVKAEEDSQDGSLPDPEATPEWEDDELDNNKISG